MKLIICRKHECPRSSDIFSDHLLPEVLDLGGYSTESRVSKTNTCQDPKEQFLEPE